MGCIEKPAYEFGRHRVSVVDRTLYRDGEIVALPPKAVEVLVELLRHAGQVVGKASLMAFIWPDTFVEESNLTQMIHLLRKAFAESSDAECIVTVPRRGYAFMGKVQTGAVDPQARAAGSAVDPEPAQSGDPAALSFYRKGRYALRTQTPEALFRALRYFRTAADLDSGLGEAFAGIAETLATLEYVGGVAAATAFAESVAAAERAVQLCPDSAAAHVSLGLIRLFFARDVVRARFCFERALQVAHPESHTLLNCACLPQVTGRLEEALAARRNAEELDPFSVIAMQEAGWPLYLMRRYEEASAQFEKVVELEPAWPAGYCGLGKVRLQQSDYSEAIRYFRAAVALSAGSGPIRALLGHACGRAGRRVEALNILRGLTGGGPDRRTGQFSVALIHIGLGNKDEAIRCLEEACAGRESTVLALKTEPMLDPVRTDRRFRDMLRALGLGPRSL